MGFLSGIEIRRRISAGEIEIHSLDGDQPFNVDSQVTEDSVDLRLAPVALRLRPGVAQLDYIHESLDESYEIFEIGAQGYELQPNEPVISQTLEAVCFPADLVGLVFTRSTFARLGIITTCLAPKFAAGIHWAFPLQLVNLNRVPVRIYPYAPMVQLMISNVVGEPIGYRGKFQDSFAPTPPRIGERERESLSSINPKAVNRTFHIINHDVRSKPPGTAATNSPVVSNEDEERREAAAQSKRVWWRALIAALSTLAALGFGIAGNLLAGGKLEYWQIVSIVLLIILSSIFTAGALAIQSSLSKPANDS